MRASTTVLGVLLFAVGAAALADDLGRLFFTPEERAGLDAARNAPPTDVAQPADDAPTAQAPAVEVTGLPAPPVTVNGLVLRAEGPSTAWVNGAPSTRQELGADPARDLRIARDAVEVDAAEIRARVKPGQTFDPAAGRVIEGFERAAPARP